MMKELSMHILDIIQNSIKAEAKKIEIQIVEDIGQNILSFSVNDNGCGMTDDLLAKVRSPFATSRTTRKVGLGIPMMEQTCIQCGGELILTSKLGEGTFIEAKMEYDNIDRPPMGDIGDAIYILLVTNLETRFVYRHIVNGNEYILDTKEINEALDGVPLNEPDVMGWLKENITEGLSEIKNLPPIPPKFE